MDHLYQTLAGETADLIAEGVYRPGDRLPGVRELSRRRNISVATAVAAYRLLEDDGRIEARPRSGFYVRHRQWQDIPQPGPSAPTVRPNPVTGQELTLRLVKAANDPRIVQLGAAVPDQSFLPTRAVEQALANTVRKQRARAVGYMFPPGVAELRREIARRMAEGGSVVNPDEIVVTNGCQEALTLALRAVTKSGDVVAIESPTFYGLLQVIDSLGLKALEIPTDPRRGISLEALQLALEQWPVRACVVVPNYSNPLGYCMPDERKRDLVALLSRHGIPLIEDDVYGDLGFGTHRPSNCKALDADVIYCSSFSKTLAPGLRVGWIAPGRHLEKVEYLKFITNLGSTTSAQLAVAEVLQSGRYERHLRQVRRQFAQAVDRMIEAIGRHFPADTRVTQPQGGFVVWVELAEDVDTLRLADRALAEGVSIAPGPIFSPTQKYRNFLRLSCACPWDGRVERALSVLARLL